MDIISLLITIAGILIILGLYILGRLSRSKMPKEQPVASVPRIIGDEGERFTSVLDDIPATDGSTPRPVPKQTEADTKNKAAMDSKTKSKKPADKIQKKQVSKAQHVLFISSNDAKGLDGNLIDKVLTQHGLQFGEMDIYHYYLNGETDKSLFRVANGVNPWTLTPQDLNNTFLPGLSLVMVTPTPIDDRQAIETFINTAKHIANDLNGKLKNQSQQLFTEKDKAGFLESI
jgi:cell division protein ZipA